MAEEEDICMDDETMNTTPPAPRAPIRGADEGDCAMDVDSDYQNDTSPCWGVVVPSCGASREVLGDARSFNTTRSLLQRDVASQGTVRLIVIDITSSI